MWVGGRIVYVRGRGDGGGGTCLVRDDARSQHQPLGLGGARFRLLAFNHSLKSGGEARKSNYQVRYSIMSNMYLLQFV